MAWIRTNYCRYTEPKQPKESYNSSMVKRTAAAAVEVAVILLGSIRCCTSMLRFPSNNDGHRDKHLRPYTVAWLASKMIYSKSISLLREFCRRTTRTDQSQRRSTEIRDSTLQRPLGKTSRNRTLDGRRMCCFNTAGLYCTCCGRFQLNTCPMKRRTACGVLSAIEKSSVRYSESRFFDARKRRRNTRFLRSQLRPCTKVITPRRMDLVWIHCRRRINIRIFNTFNVWATLETTIECTPDGNAFRCRYTIAQYKRHCLQTDYDQQQCILIAPQIRTT
jgi:hypothetical protein